MGHIDNIAENIRKRSKGRVFSSGERGQFGQVEDNIREKGPLKLFPTMEDILKGKKKKWPGAK
jgi:hypothetical protein